MGQAVPYVLGRHVHRQVSPTVSTPSSMMATPTGVDYLGLVLAAHEAEHFGSIAFRDLASPPYASELNEAEEQA